MENNGPDLLKEWAKKHEKNMDIYGTQKRISLLLDIQEALKKDRRVLLLHSGSPQELIKAYEVLDGAFRQIIKVETGRLHNLLGDPQQ